MQKIFDSSKSSEILYSELIKKSNKKSHHKTSSACNLNNNFNKWQTVEPIRLIKSNMILPLKSNNNRSINKFEKSNNNTNRSNSNVSINYSTINFRKNSNTSNNTCLVKRIKTFDDVKIIMNDEQLSEFREIIDKAFKKNKKV